MSDEGNGQGEVFLRRRSTRACDQCRRMKSKCKRHSMDSPCDSCKLSTIECTTVAPIHKRGPTKGYLRAIEGCLHEVEAVMGIILSLPSAQICDALKVLGEDPFAHTIIARLKSCPFGPHGRLHDGSQMDESISLTEKRSVYDSESKANPFVVGPTNAWQDQVLSRAMATLGPSYFDPQMLPSLSFGREDHVQSADRAEDSSLPNNVAFSDNGLQDTVYSPTSPSSHGGTSSIFEDTIAEYQNSSSQHPVPCFTPVLPVSFSPTLPTSFSVPLAVSFPVSLPVSTAFFLPSRPEHTTSVQPDASLSPQHNYLSGGSDPMWSGAGTY